ncbi:MAG: septal ring lytic transglycosylase RlpA family protein [Candidatus Obscuribacterales bacterium]|nr:septal ring lytic transglycosylase RlpA family protein [Candidatus Obscuribacterales bacterium]
MQLRLLVSYMVSVSAISGSLLGHGTVCSADARTAVKPGHSFTGYSHHYGDHLHGRKTASGQRHDKFKMTAAHRSLPFGTHLKVTNTRNGKSCVVVVNDRGPFGSESLVLDVSKAAAHKLGFPGGGKIPIECCVIDPKEGAKALAEIDESSAPLCEEKLESKAVAVKPKADSLDSKRAEKPVVATAPLPTPAALKPKVSEPSKIIASQTAKITPVVQPKEADATTFLLVINEAIEVDPAELTANAAMSSAQKTPSAGVPKPEQSPTVFVKVDDRQAGKAQQKTGAIRSIADRSENPLL